MSNQLQITGGAKVRNLEGVITGTSGVLGALPINTASGIPQLDSNGKILVSQLPNSVMEFLGVWNASTNTPYLHDGTGNAGDVYLCNVAGTVNFGSGPITFSVGDYVVYTGSVWARSSGATGTVTSVAVSESSAALNITGSPITTSGTINIGFAGTSAQYVAGDGSLITFPALTGYVPYTGATSDLNLGLFDLKTAKVWLYDNPNSGYGSMELTDGVLHFEDADGHSMVTMEDGYMTIANASTIRALLNVSGLTSNRDYAFPNASGTLALTSDLSAYVPTSRTISTTSPLQGGGDLSANRTLSILQSSSTQSGYLSSTDWNTFNNKETSLSFYSPLRRSGSSITIDQSNSTTNGYLSSTDWNNFNGKQAVLNGTGFVKASGTTISYDNSTYVTTDTTQTITGNKTFSGSLVSETGLVLKQQTGFSIAINGYSNYNAFGTELYYSIGTGASTYKYFSLQTSGLTNNTLRTYTLPNASGTLALTSDLTGGTVTSVAMSVPTGLSVSGSPITSSGTLAVSFATGYSIPTTASQTNWDTAYTNRITSLTTTGSSGSATLVSNVLNIPTYTLSGLGGQPLATNLTSLSGLTYASTSFVKMTAAGTFALDTNTYYLASNPSGFTSNTGTVTSVGLSSATSGVTIGSSPITTSGTITLAIATATSTQNGLLSSTDWNTFNGKQSALTNPVTGTGTTNTLPKFTAASTIGDSNITDTGSLITLGSNSFVNGNLGVGVNAASQINIYVSKNITGNAFSRSILSQGAIQSDVTNTALYFSTNPSTAATAFTLPTLHNYYASGVSLGAGSSVTSQYGFYAESNMTAATNNYGFYGSIPSGTNRWNLYMSGTANNYMAGSLGIGTTTIGSNFQVNGNAAIGYSASTAAPTNGLLVAGTMGLGTTAPIINTGHTSLSINGSSISRIDFLISNVRKGLIYSYDLGFSITSQGTNPLILGTNDTENARFASGGNFGINTGANIGSTLQVNGNAAIGYSASTAAPTNGLAVAGNVGIGIVTASDRLNVVVSANGNNSKFDGPTSGLIVQTNASSVDLVAYGGTTPSYRQMTFATGVTPCFTLASTGAATFSSSVQASSLLINTATQQSGCVATFNGTVSVGSLYAGSLGTGLVYSNAGTLTSTNPSDSRLKNNIISISYGLNEILQLRPVSYNWKDDKINQGIQFGFIAQEVQEIMPEAIKEFGEDVKYLGLEKDAIYAAMVNAIKELEARIKILENK